MRNDKELYEKISSACASTSDALRLLGSPDVSRCPMELQLKLALKNLRRAERHVRECMEEGV